jgi:hypothetical protein
MPVLCDPHIVRIWHKRLIIEPWMANAFCSV